MSCCHVQGVDLEHAVHRAHVNEQRAGLGREVATDITHAAAAWHDGDAARSCRSDAAR
jgi:hypothetical protein